MVDMAVRTHLMLERADRWLLQQPSLVNKSRRQLFPVVLQRQQWADALARYMTTLDLERRVPSYTRLVFCGSKGTQVREEREDG